MSIHYDNKTFTLHTKKSTYQFKVDNFGFLLHLYFGPRSEGVMDWVLSFADRGFSGSPYDAGDDRTYSLDFLPQEFPFQGTGDYRSPLLVVNDESGTFGCDLRYKGYEISEGKYSLTGLPAVYDNENNSQTLKIFLEDKRFRVTLFYGVLPELDIITRSAILESISDEIIIIKKFQTACLDFTHGNFDLITFHGRHMMERQFDRRELHHGSSIITSRRGMSSHQYNPFIILTDHEATETSGNCWAMQFVYSGGFKAEAELDQYNQTRLQIGMAEEKFSYPVKPGEKLISPEVIMTFSSEGLQKISHNLHECIRKHICRGKFRDTPRPVILNSWEACYFNFNGQTILELAKQAQSLGVDMLVLDDGWFGERYNDDKGLGDWIPNEKKLGCSLSELNNKINALGLKFGLWIEPEMVNENSNLYREHPDWALTIPGKSPVRGRGQLVLDFSRSEVREYIYKSLCKILDTCNIEYLKWDFNRSIADVYSHVKENSQGKVLYDYILGLYEFLEKLTTNYPDILIEGCAGGGGRFDAGMLYYTPQIWCSDNTDAIERLSIHYGTSFGYPISTISAHVSACPNHQTGRSVSLKTRYVSALTGAFGYELNPSSLSGQEKAEIKAQILNYKANSELIINGKFYRLSSENLSAWEYLSQDKGSVLICAVIILSKGNMPTAYVTPRGLLPGAFYRDKNSGKIYASDALMNIGLPLDRPSGDFESYIFNFERLN